MVKENEWIDISKSKNIAEAKHLNDLIKNKKSKRHQKMCPVPRPPPLKTHPPFSFKNFMPLGSDPENGITLYRHHKKMSCLL